MSPFSPLITIKNENIISMLDTRAQKSLTNKAYDLLPVCELIEM